MSVIKHMAMVAVDPPGKPERRWKCVDCKKQGTLSALCRRVCGKKRRAR